MLTRRAWLASAAGAAASILVGGTAEASGTARREILIYRSPTCGCCKLWVDHVAAAGFQPTVREVMNLDPLKQELGIPRDLHSCHTALVDGYVVEGHVPADVVLEFLEEKPEAVGLAVPGMPMGSPGMEGARSPRYEVVLFRRDGGRRVYARRG